MRLGNGRKTRQAPLADLAGTHPLAGQIDEMLAEFENVNSWNLASPIFLPEIGYPFRHVAGSDWDSRWYRKY